MGGIHNPTFRMQFCHAQMQSGNLRLSNFKVSLEALIFIFLFRQLTVSMTAFFAYYVFLGCLVHLRLFNLRP